jgi:hypothetical protein
MNRIVLAAAVLLAACSKPAEEPLDKPAESVGKAELEFVQPWARETVAGQSGTAAYLTIANFGQGEDRLVSVSARPPLTAMLHQTSNEGGVAKMRPLDAGLALPARQSVALAPGGAHIMVTGLSEPLKAGDKLPLTLRLAKSGDREIVFNVLDAAGR